MKEVNKKASEGINIPRHIEMKRVIEGKDDVCYVLQEKCRGKNCASMKKYGVPVEQLLEELKFVSTIPFEHYTKLVSDACMIYGMGYENKIKNLFYDEETGFWFIDFYRKSNRIYQQFDSNNPKKVFETLKYCPKPLQIVSSLKYGAEISAEDKKVLRVYVICLIQNTFLHVKKSFQTLANMNFFIY